METQKWTWLWNRACWDCSKIAVSRTASHLWIRVRKNQAGVLVSRPNVSVKIHKKRLLSCRDAPDKTELCHAPIQKKHQEQVIVKSWRRKSNTHRLFCLCGRTTTWHWSSWWRPDVHLHPHLTVCLTEKQPEPITLPSLPSKILLKLWMRSTTSSERDKHEGGECAYCVSQWHRRLGYFSAAHLENTEKKNKSANKNVVWKTFTKLTKTKKNCVLFASSCFSPEDKT